MSIDKPFPFRFPQGRRTALIMSYDDGSEHDRKLVNIFNEYEISGTFNLNSGHLGVKQGTITRGEVSTLYQGHEVACHTRSHPDLSLLPDAAIRQEIVADKQALEELVGYSICGLAYPFGRYDSRVVKLASQSGIEYARTIRDTYNFDLPKDFLELSTTCHHNDAMEIGQKLISGNNADTELMIVWGHSYELDGFMSSDLKKNWTYITQFCRMIRDNGSTWCAPTIEVIRYIKALQNLQNVDQHVFNSSPISVWISVNGSNIELPPGALVDLGKTISTAAA
jgi:peptidoglycan-N-acetylglucosamine deacetylase